MSEPLAVVLQKRAIREIDEIDRWWRQHRDAHPVLFLTELEAVLSAIALMPQLGAAIRGSRAAGLRRVLLRRRALYDDLLAFAGLALARRRRR